MGKKEKYCDANNPNDTYRGDNWDHVGFDPEHRLVVSVVPGKRTVENVKRLVQDFKERTGGRIMNLVTSDEYPAYKGAILHAYGEEVIPPSREECNRSQQDYQIPGKDLKYAQVHKTREKGRVAKIEMKVVFGSMMEILAALQKSLVSKTINTAFIERHNGTDRNRNARKVRKSYCFSKDWYIHEAVTYFTMYTYNFCWPVRTLRRKIRDSGYEYRTPAMAAGLADHVWSIAEWLSYPSIQRK